MTGPHELIDLERAGGEALSSGGDASYEALVSSTYVRHGDGWRLAAHQQTPT